MIDQVLLISGLPGLRAGHKLNALPHLNSSEASGLQADRLSYTGMFSKISKSYKY